LHKIITMKFIYACIVLLSMVLFSACAGDDKKAETTTATTDGPNVIIDSTSLKNRAGTNNSMPLNGNQPNVQALVSNTGQQQTVAGPSQNVQTTTVPVQQQIQQQIQQQMQKQQLAQSQQVVQTQQVQPTQQSAHPQFTAEQFKKMQDDAKKRGVQLNPAHGQPGHRCDIYVGQPLDSKPVASLAQQKPATVTTTAPPQTVTVAPQPVKTEPGMNPPHGQPGHRCDIAVGAPLNSKPATPATQTITVPANTQKTDSAKGGK
jgi:hypothetical protein